MTSVQIRKESALRSLASKTPLYEPLLMAWKRRDAEEWRGKINSSMRSLYSMGCPIHRVEIETINLCDNDCPFCPAAKRHNPKKRISRMSDKTFGGIISGLNDMAYSNTVVLSCQNEPMLDASIVMRAKQARESLPKAWLLMYTNGNFAEHHLEKYHDVLQHLDFLFIDVYNDGLEITPAARKIMDAMSHEESEKTLFYVQRMNEKRDYIEGGNNRSRWQTLEIGCTNPFSELYVQPSGNVPMCCKDVYGATSMGNLSEKPIMEVWRGAPLQIVRESLLKNGRKAYGRCEKCDFIRKDVDEAKWVKDFKVRMVGVPR